MGTHKLHVALACRDVINVQERSSREVGGHRAEERAGVLAVVLHRQELEVPPHREGHHQPDAVERLDPEEERVAPVAGEEDDVARGPVQQPVQLPVRMVM